MDAGIGEALGGLAATSAVEPMAAEAAMAGSSLPIAEAAGTIPGAAEMAYAGSSIPAPGAEITGAFPGDAAMLPTTLPGGAGSFDFAKALGSLGSLKDLLGLLTQGKRYGLSPQAFPFGDPGSSSPTGSGTAGGGLVEPTSLARILGGLSGKPASASSSVTVPGQPQGGLTGAPVGGTPSTVGGGDMNQMLVALAQLLQGGSA